MSFPVVALVLGLVLLVAATGLFRHASRQKRGGEGTSAAPTVPVPQTPRPAPDVPPAPRAAPASDGPAASLPVTPPTPSGAPVDPVGPTSSGAATGDADAPGTAEEPHPGWGSRDSADAAVAGAPAPSGPEAPQVSTVGTGPASASTADAATPTTGAEPADPPTVNAVHADAPTVSAPTANAPTVSAPTVSAEPTGSFSGRRGRRNWASVHGFEYTRDDAFLSAEWPVSLVRVLSPGGSAPVARDLVSGFVDGHQLHIADVAGSTVLALRRGAYSPVEVHMTTSAAMPAGMRHDPDLDRSPFTVYSSDTRAVGRMLDTRVETALAGLAGRVTDIAFSGAWVVARCHGRTEADHWESLLPHLTLLGTASRVLPPLVTTATLDIISADPSRPRPATGVRISAPSVVPRGPVEALPPSRPDRPGYLRAVPDVGGAGDEGVDNRGSAEPGQPKEPGESREPAVPVEEVDGRPTVERPSDPVEFPTRSAGRVLGDADLDGVWPEDVAEDGLTSIPALGEEPSSLPGAGSGDPRIIRKSASATIFSDAEGGAAGIGDPDGDQPRRTTGGRHRGPDARHAGDDGSEDAYEVVDAEVVDPEVIDPEVVDPGDRPGP